MTRPVTNLQAPDLGHRLQNEPDSYDFTLTQHERDQAVEASLWLELNRIRQNQRDAAQVHAQFEGELARTGESA